MHIAVQSHIVIHAPPVRVFAALVDLENWPRWGGNLASMERIGDEHLRIGSQFRQVTKGGRTPRESLVEVTEYVAGQCFGIKGPNLKGVFTLEAVQPGTRLHARFAVEASGPAALMYRLMLQRFVAADLRKFRKWVESSHAA